MSKVLHHRSFKVSLSPNNGLSGSFSWIYTSTDGVL
jgi:hypothetical protein